MGHYIANVRDIEFNLFEVLRLDKILDSGGYGDLDTDTVRTMLGEVARLAEGPVAQSFADADRNPPVFDPERHTISVPAELAKSVQAVKEAEWWRIGLAEEVGGVAAPAALTWAINEMILCANPSRRLLVGAGSGDGPLARRGRHPTASALGSKGSGAWVGGDDGADRARRRL